MPLDPTISLAAGGGMAAPGGQSPAQTIDTWSQAVNRINQNQLFQQTFAARQRAGQIMSAAPDLESGWTAMMKDSLVAPFAGAIVNEGRQAQKALLDIHGETSKQAMTGLEGAMKALSAGYADPSMISPMLKLHLDGLGPEARKVAAPLFDSLATSLGDGLPPGEEGISKLRARLSGLMAASGMNDAVIRGVTGTLAPEVRSGPFGPGGAERTYSVGGSYTPGLVGPGGSLPGAGGGLVPGGSGGPGGAAAPLPGGVLGLPSRDPTGGGIGLSAAATGASGGGGAASAAPPSTPSGYDPGLTSVTPEERKRQETSGAYSGTLAETMSQYAESLPGSMNRINMMEDSLGKFRAGGFASARSGLAQVLQGFKNAGVDISQGTIDKVGNESLASTQVFQSQVRPEVISQLKQAAQGTGRVMKTEVDAFLAMMGTNIDPEALRQMLNAAKYEAATRYDQVEKFSTYTGDPLKFHPQWITNHDPYSLPTHGGGLNFSPINPNNIKGAPADADLWAGWGQQGVSRGAVEHLRAHPETAKQFDETFAHILGPNASARFLRKP